VEVTPIVPVAVDQILHRLREMFGEDRARLHTDSSFRVSDEDFRIVAYPQSIEELCEMLQLAFAERWRVIPAGAGSWLEMGNRPKQFHLIISTSRMNRIVAYEPADLTATLEAGGTLTAFNRMAAERRQFIPLDPFGNESSTIGAIIAAGSSGPLRCAYGTPRDWLIGMTIVHVDGKITKAGGKVVKNVAGYDLCKLYTGSFGTLGIITEMNFKLRALPSAEKTLVFYAEDVNDLCLLMGQITNSDLQPAACEIISPSDLALPIETDRYALVLRFLAEPETIDAQIKGALKLDLKLSTSTMDETTARKFWGDYHQSETDARWEYSLQLSGLPANLNLLINDLKGIMPRAHWRAHAANGTIRVHAEKGWLDVFKHKERARKLAELRRAAQTRGGHMVIQRATTDVTDQLDVWGEIGPTEVLMRAIKDKFDPECLLNPGRFVAGI
jgi:glycolate oxidase FAD binding subunit